jgi:hypothetical protein
MTDPQTPAPDVRKIVLAAVIGLFLAMQVVLVGFVRHDTLYADFEPNTNPTPDFWGACDVGQTFVCPSPNIGRIDLSFGTHNRTTDYRVRFELFEGWPPGNLLASTEIDGLTLRNNLFTEFRFPTVRGTKGKRLFFHVLAPEATAANASALWKSVPDIVPDGTMIYSGAPDPGDLIFRVYARRTVLSELGRIVAGNPGPLNRPVVFVFVILLLEAALVWTLVSVVDRILVRRNPDV